MELETMQGRRLPWLMGHSHEDKDDDKREPRLLMLISTDIVKEQRSSNAGRDFMCKTCNRKFPTFQALGGHRTAHNRVTSASSSSSRCKPVVMSAEVMVGKKKKKKKRRVHCCSICGMEFHAGQALGGHMRKHRRFMASVAATAVGDVCLDLSLAPPNSEVGFLKITSVGF